MACVWIFEQISSPIILKGYQIKFEINKLIADKPARSFMANTASHNNIYGCHYCLSKLRSLKIGDTFKRCHCFIKHQDLKPRNKNLSLRLR